MVLTPAQTVIAKDSHRFRVLDCARRFGKTVLAVEEMATLAVAADDTKIAYIAPTFQQAHDIAWQMLKRKLSPVIVSANESRLELVVRTQHGGTSLIVLRGWVAIETLRGQAFHFLVLDETASMRNFWVGWEEVLLPTLADYEGSAMFISTPKGYNHFHDLFEMEKKDVDFKSFKYTTYDNPHIPVKEIERAKATLPEARFLQEWMAEFVKMEGLIWDLPDDQVFEPDDAVISKLLKFPDRVIGGADWGFDHPAGLLAVKIKDGSYYVTAEWKASGKTNGEIAAAAHTIQDAEGIKIWYPDSARPDAILEFQRNNLRCGDTSKDVPVGLSEVANLIRQRRLFVSAACVELLNEMDQYIWYTPPSGMRSAKERPLKENDDLCDALRYAIMGYRVREPEPKDVFAVLDRRSKLLQRKARTPGGGRKSWR